jgi:6-phosphogluconolactonase (cycloisomerase 2 family)
MRRIALLVVLAAGVAGAPSAAAASTGLVFVQTNELAGNRIVVFDRAADGRLSQAGAYPTGGKGGAAAGAMSDRLASQGSLVYDAPHSLLFAVNAGSDTVTTFRVAGDRLSLESVVPSGGSFPVSVAVHGSLVYVLNAGGPGGVSGFAIGAGGLRPLGGSTRSLGLANATPPNFLTSPGQVGFTPDGSELLVTTKASGSTIDAFPVRPDGRLSATAVATPAATPVPFAFTFDASRRLVVGEAGASAVTVYTVGAGGALTGVASQGDNQTALCWIQRAGRYFYVANTGSNTLSGYRIGNDGRPELFTAAGVVATTEPGPIDLAASGDGAFLYGETGVTGIVDEYGVGSDGTLSKLGTVGGLPAGLEGIAAT